MRDLIAELTTNQTILAIFPIVGLSIIAAIVGFYFAEKERRENREHEADSRR